MCIDCRWGRNQGAHVPRSEEKWGAQVPPLYNLAGACPSCHVHSAGSTPTSLMSRPFTFEQRRGPPMTKPLLATFGTALVGILVIASNARAAEAPSQFDRDIAPLIQRHCVKCHGPAKQEAKLNLAASSGLVRGGKSGPAIVPHDADASLLWQRVASDEMPPDVPLTADEKLLLNRWIIAGTPGLARDGKDENASDHWAFRPLVASPPSSGERARVRGPSGADAPPHKSDSPSKSFPNATSPNSIAPPSR